jgi:hypothetical protein
MEDNMLAWASAAALVCALSATLGFGSFTSLPASGQSIALLIAALAGLVLLGAFEAYEAEGPRPPDTET